MRKQLNLVMIELLKNKHKDERVVIICNGPSLNNMDLSFLNRECVIGLNKIYLGFQQFKFYPKYYVAVNRKVIEQSASDIPKLNCVKFLGDRGAGGVISEDALTYLLNTKNPPFRFCKDIAMGLHEGWTVTYAALQVAYYLGFLEVIIIGMDHNFSFSGMPNEEKVLQGEDPNHFCGSYFGNGQKWDNPDLEHSEESYEIAKRIFQQDGRRILDATVGGRCQVFEKVDYREMFSLV
jgi:hypothetical protein